MINYFECCHHCVQPKRHPGCHDTCEEYLEAKERRDKDKALYEKDITLKYYANEKSAKVKDGLAKYIRKRPRNGNFKN